MINYNKLVRDKIPDIIRSSGRTCRTKVASGDELIAYIIAKIHEELAEFEESQSIEELADLYEALEALLVAKGFTPAKLAFARRKKGESNGFFDKKLVLIDVSD